MSLSTERIIVCTFKEILVLNIAAGFSISAMYHTASGILIFVLTLFIYPLAFEALIELTYPVKEEVSAGLLALIVRIFSYIFTS